VRGVIVVADAARAAFSLEIGEFQIGRRRFRRLDVLVNFPAVVAKRLAVLDELEVPEVGEIASVTIECPRRRKVERHVSEASAGEIVRDPSVATGLTEPAGFDGGVSQRNASRTAEHADSNVDILEGAIGKVGPTDPVRGEIELS
jgi:hypothetical protein